MLAPWLADPTAKKQLETLDACVEFDLLAAGTTWDADRIRDTRIAQPLIFATSLVSAYAALTAHTKPAAVTGHSVGEWCAAVLAGVLTATDAMTLVAARGNAMALACEEEPTGLCAVLGGDQEEVNEAATARGLALANNNGPGQLVFGGTREQLDSFAASPPAKARIRSLEVAGAFHTEAMHPAVAQVSEVAATYAVNDADIPLISNRDGSMVTNGRQILDRLVDQIALPVRWDLVMETMTAIETTVAIETCPSGTLSGILRRNVKSVTTRTVDTPQDVQALLTTDLRTSELTGAHR